MSGFAGDLVIDERVPVLDAAANPIPLAAPVMTATLFSNVCTDPAPTAPGVPPCNAVQQTGDGPVSLALVPIVHPNAAIESAHTAAVYIGNNVVAHRSAR
jgi:hypothetical protein